MRETAAQEPGRLVGKQAILGTPRPFNAPILIWFLGLNPLYSVAVGFLLVNVDVQLHDMNGGNLLAWTFQCVINGATLFQRMFQ